MIDEEYFTATSWNNGINFLGKPKDLKRFLNTAINMIEKEYYVNEDEDGEGYVYLGLDGSSAFIFE